VQIGIEDLEYGAGVGKYKAKNTDGDVRSGNYFSRRNFGTRNASLATHSTNKTLLGNAGSNIMKNDLYGRAPKQLQTQFLKKGQGRGGSPTVFDQMVFDEQTGEQLGNKKNPILGKNVEGVMMPIIRQ